MGPNQISNSIWENNNNRLQYQRSRLELDKLFQMIFKEHLPN